MVAGGPERQLFGGGPRSFHAARPSNPAEGYARGIGGIARMSDDGAPASGGSFGDYQLVTELGHGGMADVFLVVMRGPAGFSKLQVLKRLRADLADDGDFAAMLMEEARLAARLHHPNIVQTNGVGVIDGRPYLTMEYLDGQP